MYYLVGTVLVLVMVFGILENFVIVYTYVKQSKVRTVDNLFIVGIAASDIGQAILGVPFVVLSSFSKHWIFGYTACQYTAFITTFLGISQVAMLTSLALDRYFIIVRCNRKLSNSYFQCSLIITSSFLFGAGWALGPLLGWSSYVEEIKGISCSVSWDIKDKSHLSFTISLLTFGWFVPLLIITYSYSSIVWTINKNSNVHQHSQNTSLRRTSRDRKVAVTVFLMIGAFVTSWLPYSIVSMWTALGNYESIPPWVQVAPAVFAKCSIVWNPIIYVARHSSFRQAIIESIVCFKGVSFLNKIQNRNKKANLLFMDIGKKNSYGNKSNVIMESNSRSEHNSCDLLADTYYVDSFVQCKLNTTEEETQIVQIVTTL